MKNSITDLGLHTGGISAMHVCNDQGDYLQPEDDMEDPFLPHPVVS